jgi:putative transposase
VTDSLVGLVRSLHSISAKHVNRLDGIPGRKVWHEYWDSQITFHISYFARLKYVHTNPVKHGLVGGAELYEWCSASWFARTASKAFYKTVMEFPSDRVVIPDDFKPSRS